MDTRKIGFTADGAAMEIGTEETGSGAAGTLLLLPALSSISTRTEMRPLMGRLAGADYRCVSTDWPGFGAAAKPRADWRPELLSQFLERFVAQMPTPLEAVVAAGHAGTYALHHLAARPADAKRLVLLAPTWRGPFPTMTGGTRPWFGRVRGAVDALGLGHLLYALNLSGPMVRRMARAHVYSDPAFVSEPARAREKRAVAKAPGARHGSVRFVTGALDRVASREAFLDLARRSGLPILLVLGEETPPRSRAEMEALAELPNVETVRLETGRLSVYEEFPEPVAAAVLAFLGR
ncbi:alpha/beta fold hydrolase [Antarcticirhabdus aurantiaca]|uniref:Alpha/beta hydrolase n=1 Tax=Antarcticirhabdus aurantiaca TaxID=2606717 RepID=A0ACD4NQM3_9HYPH|nr:alpha/beta hydrolase [Antarcticirhabdus aurantiaca]WAJ29058.1 alpha/beta hydrolase [Jeongeuplla avenae]